jgi:hypothetical protein
MDKFTYWWTMHITIPVGAIFLAYHTLQEEINESTMRIP